MKVVLAIERVRNLANEMRNQSYPQRAITYAAIKIILTGLENRNKEFRRNDGYASEKINEIDGFAKVLAHLDDVYKKPDDEIGGYLDKAAERLGERFLEPT